MKKIEATEATPKFTLPKDVTTAAAARAIIIHALRTGGKTTIELRERWGVMCPAPRVLELRMQGYGIETVPVSAHTADGVLHRGVARYVLLREPTPDAPAVVATIRAANDSEIRVQP
jgi:Helix-turn-helix domain